MAGMDKAVHLRTAWITGGLLSGAVLGGTLFPAARTWGVHFLAYYGWTMQAAAAIAAVAAVALLWTPRGSHSSHQNAKPPIRNIPDWLLVLGCGLLFTTLRAATPLLGDGQVWINEIASGTSDYLHNRAPLTLFLLHWIFEGLHPLTGLTAERLIAASSVIAGMITVAAWLRLSRTLGVSRSDALLGAFAWGGIALFCGYAETYMLMTAAVTWMLVRMLESLRRERVDYFVPFLALLGAALNWAAVVFLPAAAVYFMWAAGRRTLSPRQVFGATVLLIAAAASAYFFCGWHRGTNVLLPLIPVAGWTGAHVLSLRHAVDLANALLLAAGPLGVLLFLYIRDRAKPAVWWNSETLILFTVLLFPLAALIMHNPQLGMARDWDIAAALLAGAPIVTMVILPQNRSTVRVYRSILIAWIILVIVPWIGVQASTARSLTRFADLLRLDPSRSESGWDYLASYCFQHGRYDDWANCNIEALQRSPNPRYHANLALYYAMQQQWESARFHAGIARSIVMADSALTEWERNVTSPVRLWALGSQYNKQRNPDAAGRTWAVAEILAPGNITMNREQRSQSAGTINP